MRIYLCARVAYEARELNSLVGVALRSAGHEVYMPQEQAPNNLSQADIDEGRYDVKTIFKMDYKALYNANIVVAVGRMGSDCSWELGFAWAKNIPVVHVPGPDTTWQKSPMLIPTLTQMHATTVEKVAQRVALLREMML